MSKGKDLFEAVEKARKADPAASVTAIITGLGAKPQTYYAYRSRTKTQKAAKRASATAAASHLAPKVHVQVTPPGVRSNQHLAARLTQVSLDLLAISRDMATA